MKYFIGYLIEGEAAAWHIRCAKDIAEKFNTWKLHEKLPPHITIHYPFETEDVGLVKKFLDDWAKSHSIPGSFSLLGFDHFDDRVVFANTIADQAVKNMIGKLQAGLQQVIAVASQENLLPWHPHATLAYKLTPSEITQIGEYVLTMRTPQFILPFNNVTLFRYEGERKWIVEESYRLSN